MNNPIETNTSSEKVVVIIQARMSSSRLPGKVLKPLNGKSVLAHVVDRSKSIRNANSVVVATSINPEDDVIQEECEKINVACFRGDLKDVRSRFTTIGKEQNATFIVRVTADNPLTSSHYAEEMIRYIQEHPEIDYCRMKPDRIIHGSGSEVFRFSALIEAEKTDLDDYNKEHVTPKLISSGRFYEGFELDTMLKRTTNLNLSIDTSADYIAVQEAMTLYPNDTISHCVEAINQGENL